MEAAAVLAVASHQAKRSAASIRAGATMETMVGVMAAERHRSMEVVLPAVGGMAAKQHRIRHAVSDAALNV
jgi:hypothetical protein